MFWTFESLVLGKSGDALTVRCASAGMQSPARPALPPASPLATQAASEAQGPAGKAEKRLQPALGKLFTPQNGVFLFIGFPYSKKTNRPFEGKLTGSPCVIMPRGSQLLG